MNESQSPVNMTAFSGSLARSHDRKAMPALTSSRMPDSLSSLSIAAASFERMSASFGVGVLPQRLVFGGGQGLL